MSDVLTLPLAGETVLLHGDRALYYPAERALLVADTHFGKGAFLRRQGLAVPGGGSAADLDRLSALIGDFRPERLIVLGDFFHHRPRPGEPFLAAWPRWRAAHPTLTPEVVIGNHDRHAEGLDLDLIWHDELDLGPFRLRHDPEPVAGRHVLGGHLHPAYRLRGAGDGVRAPVFWLREAVTVLPAFGGLTGGWAVRPGRGERVVLALDGGLYPLPAVPL